MAFWIQLDPSGRRFPCASEQSILEAAEDAGVPWAHGCRVGACRTCVARLLAGHVAMPPGTALTPTHLADDLLLPCVARARSDVLLQTGDTLGPDSGAAPLPWTD